jgi:hypothetical protein
MSIEICSSKDRKVVAGAGASAGSVASGELFAMTCEREK